MKGFKLSLEKKKERKRKPKPPLRCCKHGLLEELCALEPKVPLKQNEKMRIPIQEHQRTEWGERGKR